MKMLVQRVKHAKVTVDGNVTGAIEQGYLVLLGVAPEDTTAITTAKRMIKSPPAKSKNIKYAPL